MSNTNHHYAIFSSLYFPHPGGVEVFTDNLAHELESQGHQATIVTMRIDASSSYERLSDGVDVHRLPCRPFFGGRLPWTVHSSEYEKRFDKLMDLDIDRVVVNTRFYPHSLEGLRLARAIGAPAIVLDHGSDHICFGNAMDPLVEVYEHAITKKVITYRPTFCGISQASVKWLEHFDIDAKGVIPNAIDAKAFRERCSGMNYRAELGIDPHSPIVSYVGRLTPEKGPHILVKVARQMSDLSFVLAGDGTLFNRLAADKPDNVFFLGNIGRENLSALMSQSDFFCLPTRSEGFCTSLLEAGAYGVPFVVPEVGGAFEVAGDSSVTRITKGRSTNEIASALASLVSMSTNDLEEGRQALRYHVEHDCGWAAVTASLDRAFLPNT